MSNKQTKSSSSFGFSVEDYAAYRRVSPAAVRAALAAGQLTRALDGSIYRDHPPIGLSQAQYAAHRARLGLRGGTRQMVHKAHTDGWLTLFVDGTIDAEASDRSWAEIAGSHAEGRCEGPGTETDDDPFAAPALVEAPAASDGAIPNIRAEKARRAKAEAEIARMEADKMAGRMVDAADVERRWAEITEIKRRHIMGLPARLARTLAGKTDEAEISAIIERECVAALEGASVEITKLTEKED